MKVMALSEQMEMFEDGGLKDEGGTVDPVSGNDVPPGSTQEEVRDDIPAQLSEGEFVMPADVVRYHGLDKMMQLRQEAKIGLKIMDEMGQMGNSEEATIPDDLPFNFEDLELDDEPREMQVGGYVAPNLPMQTQQSSFANYTPQYNVPQQNQFTPYTPPVQEATPTAPKMDTLPTFKQFVPAAGEPRKYINPETGAILMIPVDGQGNLMYPPPAGFVLESEYQAPTPDPVTTPAPVQQVSQQQTEKDSGTPEVDAYNAERQKLMRERKEAAKNLGYTKEQSTGAAILGFLTKGLVGGDEERGTIMQDGTIADGQGNYFDPLSGEQRGFLGTTNRGKGEFQVTQEMYDQGVTPASLAGLRNMIGDKSIEDLIGKPLDSVDRVSNNLTSEQAAASEDINITTDPRDVKVKTATVTSDPDATVSEVAKPEYKGIGTDKYLGELKPLDFETATNVLKVGEPKQMLDALTNKSSDGHLQANRALSDLRAQASGEYSNYTDSDVQVARSALNYFEKEGRIPKEDKPSSTDLAASQDAQAFRRAEARRMGVDFMSSATARKTDARNKLDDAKKSNPKQYRADVRSGKYDKEFDIIDRSTREENLEKNSRPNKAGVNLAEKVGTENASKIRDDQGTATNVDSQGRVAYSNDHDWSKKTQLNVNEGQSSGAQEKADTRGKIVCTEMYRQTQLDDWAKAMKIWDVYQRKYLTPYHEVGYHWLFKPYVKGMQSSNVLTKFGAFMATKRTKHLKYILTKGIAKDDIVGNIWCKIIHPIVYAAGKIKTWKK